MCHCVLNLLTHFLFYKLGWYSHTYHFLMDARFGNITIKGILINSWIHLKLALAYDVIRLLIFSSYPYVYPFVRAKKKKKKNSSSFPTDQRCHVHHVLSYLVCWVYSWSLFCFTGLSVSLWTCIKLI